MKVMCIGHAAYDITIPITNFIEENKKHRYLSTVQGGGGPACTAAYLLGKWGIPTSFVGAIGNDSYGRVIMEELVSVGVDISQIQVLKTEQTSASFVLINKENGSRTIVAFQNPDISSTYVDIKTDADVILFDGQEYDATKNILYKNQNILSVMDAGRYTKENVELARLANYIICSKEFAEEATGMKFNFEDVDSISQIYYELKNKFSGKIVVTLEDKGCMYEENGNVTVLKALSVDPVDTTGAGDIFHGAFVYALVSKLQMKDALLFANIAAGLSTQHLGTRNSIPSVAQVMKVYYEIK